ncbi:P-loop NTPase fold protein [Paraburkholderia tagetis]|uniref:KAP family NTPase n=1 Tax=Paraburkholderia tagetis TaxID=2913261 RepID=A0A9X1UME6_9BURK|nr:KAP family NTPase [Paraburkholderia tagetis]
MLTVPKLLIDEPATRDILGGAHQRIAQTIASLVLTSEGGQTIRLDGTWGSGKSTVVRLLVDALEQHRTSSQANDQSDEEIAVFMYDAWVHSGDPMRRSFFAGLVSKIGVTGWLSEATGSHSRGYWKDRLDRLSRRFKTTHKRSSPVFSTTTKLVLSGLIGLGVVSPFLATLEKRLADHLHTLPLVAFTVLLAGIAFAGLHLLSDKAMGLVIRRSSEDETVDVREEPEPTSIEFQEAFGELMDAVLLRPGRKLVIVVDNLDRIDAAETKSAWTLLRSFLDNPEFSKRAWFRKLWVIVPVADENKLKASVANGHGSNTSDARQNGPSFFEKVFQIRLSLPPLMLHSWKNFLHQSLTSAFGEDLSGEYEDILRLYEDSRAAQVTPRAIVSFVNDLVVARLEWQDKVPLAVLAAFILYGSQFPAADNSLPKAVTKILRQSDLAGQFAMLHHRANSLSEASYITVLPQLEAALDASDSERISLLVQSSPATEHILDRFIREGIPELASQQGRLLQATRALIPLISSSESVGSAVKLSATTVAHLRSNVLSAFADSRSLRLNIPDLKLGLQALLDLSPNRVETAQLILHMLRAIVVVSADSKEYLNNAVANQFDTWSSNLRDCLTLTEVRELTSKSDFENIVLPVDSESWSQLCARYVNSEDEWILNRCTSRSGWTSDLDWLRSQASSGFSDAALSLLTHHRRQGRDDFVDELGTAVVGLVQDAKTDIDAVVKGAIFLFQADRVRARPYIKEISSTTFPIALTRYANGNAFTEALAATIYLVIFSNDGEFGFRASSGLTSDAQKQGMHGLNIFKMYTNGQPGLDKPRAEIFGRVLRQMNAFEILDVCAEKWGVNKFVMEIVSALAADVNSSPSSLNGDEQHSWESWFRNDLLRLEFQKANALYTNSRETTGTVG